MSLWYSIKDKGVDFVGGFVWNIVVVGIIYIIVEGVLFVVEFVFSYGGEMLSIC